MTNRIEVLKDNPIIDENYKPFLKMDYMNYFNRAMVFAQTNYQEQLTKLANTHFQRITPGFFFEEYVWVVCTTGENFETVNRYFTLLNNHLESIYCSFFLNSKALPNEENIKILLLPFINETKCKALWKTARILKNGIRLFSWNKYRNNFLDSVQKLQALPFINSINSCQLANNIGIKKSGISETHLCKMAIYWGFNNPNELCDAISKKVVLQTKVISQILWYAGTTFGTNISEP